MQRKIVAFKMNTQSQSQTQERAYIALLGLAEHFRTHNNIRKSIQCLEAVRNRFALFSPKMHNFYFSSSRSRRSRRKWKPELISKSVKCCLRTQTTLIWPASTSNSRGRFRSRFKDSTTFGSMPPAPFLSSTSNRISPTWLKQSCARRSRTASTTFSGTASCCSKLR